MARFKRGDRVVVLERDSGAADRKSGLYYSHFRGLRGVVDQVYEEEGEVCVNVDLDSLPEDFLRRHQSIQDQARKKWLNGLSESERRSLSDDQKQVPLKYTVMVAPEDLAPEGRDRARKPANAPAADAAPVRTAAPKPSAKASTEDTSARAKANAATRRPTETDLEALERAHFDELARQRGGKSSKQE